MTILDRIQKIPSKTRVIVFAVAVVVIAVVFVRMYYIPMNAQIRQLQKDVAELQAKVQENDLKIQKLDELKAEVKTLQARLKLMTEQLPPGSEVSGLLRQIQNLVNQSGLVLKLWRPDKRKTHSSGLYEEIPINMELDGGYHNLGVFIDRVSKLTRIVNILDLRLGTAKIEKSGGLNIKITCKAMTFAAVEKKPDAATATGAKKPPQKGI